MARTREPKSKGSFCNFGLKKEEDERLIKLLEDKDLNARRLVRALLRQWVNEKGENGTLKMTR